MAAQLGTRAAVPQVDAVIAACCHPEVVRGLFSATLPESVETLARRCGQRRAGGRGEGAGGAVGREICACASMRWRLSEARSAVAAAAEPAAFEHAPASLPTATRRAPSVLADPLRITVGERNTAAATVGQRLLFVGREAGKLLALRQAISGGLVGWEGFEGGGPTAGAAVPTAAVAPPAAAA